MLHKECLTKIIPNEASTHSASNYIGSFSHIPDASIQTQNIINLGHRNLHYKIHFQLCSSTGTSKTNL